MREVLDQAQNIKEAVEIFKGFNLDIEGGPPLHYLIADATGQSLLIEYFGGKMVVIPSEGAWQGATNFLQAPVRDNPEGQCWRFDAIVEGLYEEDGQINKSKASNF